MSKTITIDPVTRIEGHLAAKVEVESGKVAKAFVAGEMFRGFEQILRGRDPLDAQHITQRICGVCPVEHGTASVLAQEMAYNLAPSDNGWIQSPDANGPMKSKLTQYDGGLRTPIILRWPAKVKPRMSDDLAISVDFAPTILTAVGLKPTAEMQGINLLDDQAVAARKAIFGECFTHNAVDIHKPASSLCWRWVIEGTWKLIVPAPQNKPEEKIELYDLAKDSHEESNLAEKEPQRVERLKQLLDHWWAAKS